jgi:FdhD protein
MASPLRSFSIRRMRCGSTERVADVVAAEEPLDIRIGYRFKDVPATRSLALAMRTPGNDRELAAGLLLSEGIIATREDVAAVRELGTEDGNEILVELSPDVDFEDWQMRRNTLLSSSCGLCGKLSRETIAQARPLSLSDFTFSEQLLYSLPALIESQQPGFLKTGGLHAAALIDTNGSVQKLYEDIGRHNAMDKLLGSCLLENHLPVANRILFLSSRSSFELVHKAAMAGGCFLATVGGPSSLAIETARRLGMTLAGFVREDRCNIYSGEWRIHSK